MHGILIRILTTQLVFQEGLEQICEPARICVGEEWPGREYDIDSLRITVRRDFFEETERVLGGVGVLQSSKGLTKGQSGDQRIVGAAIGRY